jgi:2-succinyl-5-enolpyruvyl-6-hydroxy-3-cyclohexene-1-carboxylate synthase
MDDRPDIGSLNLRWATALVEGLAGAGVQHAVLSPGSRCTPLTLACEARLNTRVMVDERSAAFCALGLAKARGQPVALVCTSGTAVANWYPAVVEASYGRVPLVLMSADRPPEIQGFGANQTIDQVKLFGDLVRAYHGLPPADRASFPSLGSLAARAVDQSLWPMPGPVHLNVPFREPLVPSRDAAVEPADPGPVARLSRPILVPDRGALADLADRLSARCGLIVCGELPPAAGFAQAVAALAAALDCPILADPLSNLRRGAHDRDRILCRYDAWMQRPDVARDARPDWIIRFGSMPVSKALHQYLGSTRPPLHLLVDAHGAWPDPQQRATFMVRADPAAFCERLAGMAGAPAPRGWREGFEALERRAAELLASEEGSAPFEWEILRELLAGLPPDATLFIGNSMPIRDLDTCLGPDAKPLKVLANRGASGIDGNVSTLAGLAAGCKGSVAGMIGDLALFHDLNGLHALRGQDAILVVVNNGGGGIFRYLPQAGLSGFERNWLTPTGLDFGHAARLFGLRHRRAACRQEFAEAFTAALSERGPQLIEAMVDPDASVARHRAYWDRVAET